MFSGSKPLPLLPGSGGTKLGGPAGGVVGGGMSSGKANTLRGAASKIDARQRMFPVISSVYFNENALFPPCRLASSGSPPAELSFRANR
jgi:hypothetical protein